MKIKFKIDLFDKLIPIKVDIPDEYIAEYCGLELPLPLMDLEMHEHIVNMVNEAIMDTEVEGNIMPVDKSKAITVAFDTILNKHIKKLKLSDEECAKILGVNVELLLRWKSGITTPTPRLYQTLCDTLKKTNVSLRSSKEKIRGGGL